MTVTDKCMLSFISASCAVVLGLSLLLLDTLSLLIFKMLFFSCAILDRKRASIG